MAHYDRQAESIRSIETVLRVLENLFFSLPISEEVARKYNYLKENKFRHAGLLFSPITKTQYPSIGTKSDVCDSEQLQALEKIFTSILSSQVELYDSILNSIAGQGELLLESIKGPVKLSGALNSQSTYTGMVKDKVMEALREYNQKKISMQSNTQLRATNTLGYNPLSEAVSQMLYKSELAKSKVLSTMKALRSELEMQGESYRIKEGKLVAEMEILHSQINKLGDGIGAEVMKVRNDYDSLLARLKEQHEQELLNLHHTIDELKGQCSVVTEEKSFQTSEQHKKDVEDYMEKLEHVVIAMRERLKAYYEIQRPLQTSWKEEDADTEVEEILYTEFVLYCANKYEADGKWLNEQMEILEKENKQLKEIAVASPQALQKVQLFVTASCGVR